MAETNSLAEQTPEELAEAQYHTTLRGFGVFIFPQVSATQMKECGACRRKCRPAEFDYKVTPIRFGSFGEGAVITFCDKCYAPFKVALSALTTTAHERDEAQMRQHELSIEAESLRKQMARTAPLEWDESKPSFWAGAWKYVTDDQRSEMCAAYPEMALDYMAEQAEKLVAVQQERDALRAGIERALGYHQMTHVHASLRATLEQKEGKR